MEAFGKGVKMVSDQKVKETLEKQLQLLSERSEKSFDDYGLASLTREMVNVCRFLHSFEQTS